MINFIGPRQRFGLGNTSGYNIPKPKFLYFVRFVPNQTNAQNFFNGLGFLVKRTGRIQVQYDVQEMNQYNRRRLIQSKLKYGPLELTFHDTIDEKALRLFEAYNQFYYGDFDNKNNNSWIKDINTSNFEGFSQNWGLKGTGTAQSDFLQRIEIYEMFDQRYTQVNFINPKFISVDFQNLDQEVSLINEVNLLFWYEGIKIERKAAFITPDKAALFGLPFKIDQGIPFNSLIQQGTQFGENDIFSSLNGPTSLISNLINNPITSLLGSTTALSDLGGFVQGFASSLGNVSKPQISSSTVNNLVFDALPIVGNLFSSFIGNIANGELSTGKQNSGTSNFTQVINNQQIVTKI